MPGATAAVAGDVAGVSEPLTGHCPRAQAGAASSSTTSPAEINERIRRPIRLPRSCISMHGVGVKFLSRHSCNRRAGSIASLVTKRKSARLRETIRKVIRFINLSSHSLRSKLLLLAPRTDANRHSRAFFRSRGHPPSASSRVFLPYRAKPRDPVSFSQAASPE